MIEAIRVKKRVSGVAITHLLFAERSIDSTSYGIAEPDDGSQ
jgi:hypothetical protein